MSTFKSIPFKLVPADGRFPQLARDTDGVQYLTATIELASQADFEALRDLEAVVDVRPAMGAFHGYYTVQRRKSALVDPEGTLSVPFKKGTYGLLAAVLVGLRPQVSGKLGERYRAEARWLIVDDEVVP